MKTYSSKKVASSPLVPLRNHFLDTKEILSSTPVQNQKNKSASWQKVFHTKSASITNKLKVKKPASSTTKQKKYQQLFLSLGQRNPIYTPYTCPDCQMTYSRLEKEDEKAHLKYHQIIVSGMEISWKLEWLVEPNILLLPPFESLNAALKKKLLELFKVMFHDLGSSSLESEFINQCRLFIYLKDDKAVGCSIVESITKAYEFNGTETLNTNDPKKSLAGINRIWVSKSQRRQGIGSKLLEAVSKHFIYGFQIEKDQIAFSQPTQLGQQLAKKFTDKENFLVYLSEQ